jgi:hypothetical protein
MAMTRGGMGKEVAGARMKKRAMGASRQGKKTPPAMMPPEMAMAAPSMTMKKGGMAEKKMMGGGMASKKMMGMKKGGMAKKGMKKGGMALMIVLGGKKGKK